MHLIVFLKTTAQIAQEGTVQKVVNDPVFNVPTLKNVIFFIVSTFFVCADKKSEMSVCLIYPETLIYD